MLTLKNSGYSEKFRSQIIKSAKNAFRIQLEKEKIGRTADNRVMEHVRAIMDEKFANPLTKHLTDKRTNDKKQVKFEFAVTDK